jgi:hypothetical protein
MKEKLKSVPWWYFLFGIIMLGFAFWWPITYDHRSPENFFPSPSTVRAEAAEDIARLRAITDGVRQMATAVEQTNAQLRIDNLARIYGVVGTAYEFLLVSELALRGVEMSREELDISPDVQEALIEVTRNLDVLIPALLERMIRIETEFARLRQIIPEGVEIVWPEFPHSNNTEEVWELLELLGINASPAPAE